MWRCNQNGTQKVKLMYRTYLPSSYRHRYPFTYSALLEVFGTVPLHGGLSRIHVVNYLRATAGYSTAGVFPAIPRRGSMTRGGCSNDMVRSMDCRRREECAPGVSRRPIHDMIHGSGYGSMLLPHCSVLGTWYGHFSCHEMRRNNIATGLTCRVE